MLTEDEKAILFTKLGFIEANQINTAKNIDEIKKTQKEHGKAITGIRVKSARDAGIVSSLIGLGVIVKTYFSGGGQ